MIGYSEDSEIDSPDVSNDSDDVLDETLSDQSLDDLKNSFQLERQTKGEAMDFLNESTADFNKAIKQINFQLRKEGHLDQNNLVRSFEKEERLKLRQYAKQTENQTAKHALEIIS